MKKVYGIGETVFDLIFKEGLPQAGKAGGSVLNSMVSLGRIGMPVSFISEYGQDDVGSLVDSFLKTNGVDTSFVYRFRDGNTSLALAFLDEKNDAHYTFYKDFPDKRLDIEFPRLKKNDIVQCGSFYAIWKDIRTKFLSFLQTARKNNALILYDPNFRKTHISDLGELRPMIIENMELATVVRGSDEDFRNIFGSADADETYSMTKQFCPVLVYTSSTEGVQVRTPNTAGKYPVRKIVPVSTIGAGDNFNAGMIASIYRNGFPAEQIKSLGEREWRSVISTAVDFASEVCLSYENYISNEFADKFKSAS